MDGSKEGRKERRNISKLRVQHQQATALHLAIIAACRNNGE